MQRRIFVTLLGGTVAVWLPGIRAQQTPAPVVGYLYVGEPEPSVHLAAAFRAGLDETGYVDGRNVVIESRFARNDVGRLPELAADLVRRAVAVIATPSSVSAALAAKDATSTIPIVFNIAGDPVQAGLVASRERPGGNLTGITSMNPRLMAERLRLLLFLVPEIAEVAVLVNPQNRSVGMASIADAEAAASEMGRSIEVLTASSAEDIDDAFVSIARKSVDALLVSPDVLFSSRREQLVKLAARHVLPTIYSVREITESGGLMSYGPSLFDQFRQAGIYIGRILKGEKPGDLPVRQATQFEFVINLKTAGAFGIKVPDTMLMRADAVIE
jgi:putative tryptophan/tyrosine transport system substrate-binding protein